MKDLSGKGSEEDHVKEGKDHSESRSDKEKINS